MTKSAFITIFDTTLRDGEQSPGCSMNPAEKLRLARQLERLGVDVIEAGFPIASLAEVDAVERICGEIQTAKIAALARCKPKDIEVAAHALRRAARPVLHTFLATSALHLRDKLKITADQALQQAREGVALAKSLIGEVEFSAEDASRTEYAYLLEVLRAVHEAGARVLNVPDTVGYSLPDEYAEMVRKLVRDIPTAVISVHCHNDLGLAVANSIAAISAGAGQVECTINGIGERAGNTSLEEIVMALRVRREALGFDTRVNSELLAPTSADLSSITGVWPQPNKAIVGRNAFAHEAGIHQHGILANPLTYEIMTPKSVGVGETLLVLGKHSGRHAVEKRLRALGVKLNVDQLDDVTMRVKELADRKKFVYDDDLLALLDQQGERRPILVRYQTLSGNGVIPTATVEIDANGERRTASSVGNGPLDAALKAIDLALGVSLELLDWHTRSVSSGKDAFAEVTVRVRHRDQETVGQAASTDSIEASLKAYLSAIGAAERAIEVAA
ncbi:MAG: 2-isopropylmalate synthase [Vicinamibacteria bacterium]